MCQVRLWASWTIILHQVRLWVSLRIILLQVRLWNNCGWSSCVRSGCSLSAPAHAVDQLKDCHTGGQAVVQLENLPASGHPVGRLEDHPLLGQHVGQLKDGSVSGQVVGSSGWSSCARSGCGPAEGSFCFRLGCEPAYGSFCSRLGYETITVELWMIFLCQVRMRSSWGFLLSQVSLQNSFCTRSDCRTTSRGSPRWHFIVFPLFKN